MFVSFVIPAYNVEKYISKTLRSLFSQTDRDLEIIVVNDGSTDQTEQVAYEVLSNSGFKNYKIISKENGGPSSARNRGLKEAQGQYIIFLDGDDYVVPTLVEELKKALKSIKNTKIDVFCWRYLKVDELGNVLNPQPPFQFSSTYNLLDGVIILRKALVEKKLWTWTGNLAYSRSFLFNWNLFYDERYRFSEDYEFEWRVLLKKPTVLVINKILSFYVQRTDSLTKSRDTDFKRLDSYLAIKKLYNDLNNVSDSSIADDLKRSILEQAVIQFINCLCHLRRTGGKTFSHLLKELRQKFPDVVYQVSDDVKTLLKSPSKTPWKWRVFLTLLGLCPSISLSLWYYYPKFKEFVGHVKTKIQKAISDKELL